MDAGHDGQFAENAIHTLHKKEYMTNTHQNVVISNIFTYESNSSYIKLERPMYPVHTGTRNNARKDIR